MLIRQENGAGKIGYGVSLKDPNQTGKYYCYVWDKRTFNYDEVKAIREAKGNNNFSKTRGWRSLGRWGNAGTLEKVYEHLIEVYGQKFTLLEVQEHLQKEVERLEKERKEKLTLLNTQLIQAYNQKGIKQHKLGDTIREAKKLLKAVK